MVRLARAAILSCLCVIAMQVCAHGETPSQENPPCSLIKQINEARRLLEKSPGLRYDEHKVTRKVKSVVKQKGRKVKVTRRVTTRELYRQEIVLAVLDMKTGRTFTASFWLNTEDIAQANRLRAICANDPDIPTFHPYKSGRDFEVVVNRWNTYNSDLSLKNKGQENAEQYVVIANKYLVPSSRLDRARSTKLKYTDVVYAPYSSAIHSDALIDAGKEFLSEQVARAFASLKKRQVESHAYPGKLVTDTISESFIRHLLINEHSDPRLMLAAEDKGRQVAERFLILLAANGQRAFRFTNSSTGAIGIAQIMPKTYDYVAVKYPDAELIRNTDVGRSEIENAIKASILVCDDLMAAVIRKMGGASSLRRANYRRLFDEKSEDELDEIRAAIYNGGPGKYIPATGSISPRVSETVYFVKKLNLIRELNLFESIPPTALVD